MLAAWDERLVDYGMLVLEKRRAFVWELSEVFQSYYETLSLGREQVRMEYMSSIKEADFLTALRQSRERDRILTYLKFAQFAYLARQNGVRPLLLLDDIFDKLDAERVKQIVRLVASDRFGQVFITDTNREHIDEILREYTSSYKIFNVNNGGVE